MQSDLSLSLDNIEIEFANKEKADLESNAAFLDETTRNKPNQIGTDITNLKIKKLNPDIAARGLLEDALRRALVCRSENIALIKGIHPPLPTVKLGREDLEKLANMGLPDDVAPLPRKSLPSDEALINGLKRNLSPKGRERVYPSIVEPSFVQIVLDEVWRVPNYHGLIFGPALPRNPRKVMDFSKFAQVMPDSDSFMGTPEEFKAYPAISSLLFRLEFNQEN